jgi:catechol 2,3-dioxygenase-like lactoylglutathione lyase family enzyme
VTVTSMYHFGVLVYDLEAAVERFTDLFGLTFNDPTVFHLSRAAELNGEHPIDIRATYSRQGPPYMELVEAKGNGVWRAELGEGLHHVGMWDPSIEKNAIDYQEKGLLAEARILGPTGDAFTWYSNPDNAHGIRFEFVDEAQREDLEKWIQTGKMQDGSVTNPRG